jgi:hypothetical protein
MSNRNCPVCGATWIDSQLYWSGTGKPGKDLDLAALVCNRLPAEKIEGCVNPKKGCEGGIGWEEREKILEQGLDGL